MSLTTNSTRRRTPKWWGTHKRGLARMAKRNNVRLQQMRALLPPFGGRSNPNWRLISADQHRWSTADDGKILRTPVKSNPSPKTRFWRLSTLRGV